MPHRDEQHEQGDPAEADDDAGEGHTVTLLHAFGLFDLGAGDEAEDDAERRRNEEEEAGAAADQCCHCQAVRLRLPDLGVGRRTGGVVAP